MLGMGEIFLNLAKVIFKNLQKTNIKWRNIRLILFKMRNKIRMPMATVCLMWCVGLWPVLWAKKREMAGLIWKRYPGCRTVEGREGEKLGDQKRG